MLVVTFATLTVALFALFWGGSRFLQAYVYNEPANKLAIRGLIAGLLVGGFLTFWVFVNTRAESKDRYGTFFEFNPTSSHPFDSFEAIRREASLFRCDLHRCSPGVLMVAVLGHGPCGARASPRVRLPHHPRAAKRR